MDVIYAKGEATAAEVQGEIPDPPSYSAVRATLRILVEKGHLEFRKDGPRYVFRPTTPAGTARSTALHDLVRSIFGGSRSRALAALLDESDEPLEPEEVERMRELIERAREEGR